MQQCRPILAAVHYTPFLFVGEETGGDEIYILPFLLSEQIIFMPVIESQMSHQSGYL